MSKQKPGIYRTTISIPQDLKRRMDKAGSDVNWSAIAATAFEAKLAEIAARKVKKNMDDVIQRLRGSKQAAEAEAYKDGFSFGQNWGKDYADVSELRRLEGMRNSVNDREWELMMATGENDAYSVRERFVFNVRPEDDGDRRAADIFWEESIGDDDAHRADDDEFVRGFADGALSLWEQIKDKI